MRQFGLIVPQGIGPIAGRVPELIEDATNELPGSFRMLVEQLLDHLKVLDMHVLNLVVKIKAWHRESEISLKLEQIPGIGAVTASAPVATIGDAKAFENARQLAAWMGLVSRQHSSGGKAKLLGISKLGDAYLRTLLIHGARSTILDAQRKAAKEDSWLGEFLLRRNPTSLR